MMPLRIASSRIAQSLAEFPATARNHLPIAHRLINGLNDVRRSFEVEVEADRRRSAEEPCVPVEWTSSATQARSRMA